MSKTEQAEPVNNQATLERNKNVSREWVSRMNAHDLDGALTLLDDTCVNHTPAPGMPAGNDGAKAFITMLFTGFPDLSFTALNMTAEGDKVARFTRVEGTHSGEFMGIPATGKKASWLLMEIDRYADGKVVEHWNVVDNLSMMQQLGLIPSR
jgi:steroid delta-isomerase-like uncharacterized protein